MITIKDIALKANVSPGTVDRVIHKRGGVSVSTEKLIKKIIKKNNFKINFVASALAKKKDYKIATLIPNYDNDNLFWKSPYLGIKKASNEIDIFGFKVYNFKYSQTNLKSYLSAFNKLLKINPDGVIIVPAFKNETNYILENLDKKNIPYVFLNIFLDGYNNLSFIGQDPFKSGYLAGKLLHTSLGKKPKFLTVKIASKLKNDGIRNRIKGFEEYFLDKQVKTTSFSIVFESLDKKKDVSSKINSILESNPEIKGVFVPSSRVSVISNSIKNINENDLKIIGFDTTDQNIKCLKNDKITFLISQKSFNQGYKSVLHISDFLFRKIIPERKSFSPIEIITKENLEFTNKNRIDFAKREMEVKNLINQ